MRALSKNLIVVVIVSVLVVAALVAGVLVLDPPSEERLRRLDERRSSDLHDLSFAVDRYWSREGVLPSSLTDLLDDISSDRLHDPEFGNLYEYRILDAGAYELCADFARENRQQHASRLRGFWWHSAGVECFRLEPQDIDRPIERR